MFQIYLFNRKREMYIDTNIIFINYMNKSYPFLDFLNNHFFFLLKQSINYKQYSNPSIHNKKC